MARERDVRSSIRDVLIETGAFSSVRLTGLPEDYGEGSTEMAVASIQPDSTSMIAGWDAASFGGRAYSCRCVVTILARHVDAELCDDLAEQLLEIVRNAVDGQPLVPGFNEPEKTMVSGWQWLPRTAPERRIVITLAYEYLQDGWNDADASP